MCLPELRQGLEKLAVRTKRSGRSEVRTRTGESRVEAGAGEGQRVKRRALKGGSKAMAGQGWGKSREKSRDVRTGKVSGRTGGEGLRQGITEDGQGSGLRQGKSKVTVCSWAG